MTRDAIKEVHKRSSQEHVLPGFGRPDLWPPSNFSGSRSQGFDVRTHANPACSTKYLGVAPSRCVSAIVSYGRSALTIFDIVSAIGSSLAPRRVLSFEGSQSSKAQLERMRPGSILFYFSKLPRSQLIVTFFSIGSTSAHMEV